MDQQQLGDVVVADPNFSGERPWRPIEEAEADDPRRIPRSLGRDELNLAEFPLTALCDRVPAGCKTLVFEDTDPGPGDRGDGHPEVDHHRQTTQYGLPTALDDDVIVGLIQLTKAANNFTEPDRSVLAGIS